MHSHLLTHRHFVSPFKPIKEIIMTVKEHLMLFLDYHLTNKLRFKTHEIQELSSRGKTKFGKRLGSPGTYTRQFRYIKEDLYDIEKLKSPNSNEAMWEVRRKND